MEHESCYMKFKLKKRRHELVYTRWQKTWVFEQNWTPFMLHEVLTMDWFLIWFVGNLTSEVWDIFILLITLTPSKPQTNQDQD